MPYAAKFVLVFWDAKLGKRVVKQIIYLLLMTFVVERKVIREVFGASESTPANTTRRYKKSVWKKCLSRNTIILKANLNHMKRR